MVMVSTPVLRNRQANVLLKVWVPSSSDRLFVSYLHSDKSNREISTINSQIKLVITGQVSLITVD